VCVKLYNNKCVCWVSLFIFSLPAKLSQLLFNINQFFVCIYIRLIVCWRKTTDFNLSIWHKGLIFVVCVCKYTINKQIKLTRQLFDFSSNANPIFGTKVLHVFWERGKCKLKIIWQISFGWRVFFSEIRLQAISILRIKFVAACFCTLVRISSFWIRHQLGIRIL